MYQKENLQNQTKDTAIDDLEMYSVPGHRELGPKDFARYQQSQKQDHFINELSVRTQEEFSLLFKENKHTAILGILRNPAVKPEAKIKALYLTKEIEEPSEMVFCINQGLLDANEEVQVTAAEMIEHVPQRYKAALTEKALLSNYTSVKIVAGEMIWYTGSHHKQKLEQTVLQKIKTTEVTTPQETLENIALIEYCPENEQKRLKEEAFQLLKSLYSDESTPVGILIEGALKIRHLLPEHKIALISLYLESNHPSVQAAAARMIRYAPTKSRLSLVEIALKSTELSTKTAGVKALTYTNQGNPRKSVTNIIVTEAISLLNETTNVSKELLQFIQALPIDSSTSHVIQAAQSRGIDAALVSSALYTNVDEEFFRKEFIKTGSELTLLGDTLKNRVVIRTVEPTAFLNWKKLYESSDLWKKNGFEHVPIEPILEYRVTQNNLVRVYCGVLDLTLQQWNNKSSLFQEELIEQKERILKTLTEASIDHGHPHDDNFCLRFFRTEDGSIDFSTPPRLYLIDFDRTSSTLSQDTRPTQLSP